MNKIYYYEVALDKPLYQLFTYQYHQPIALGSRVSVPFINQYLTGIVFKAIDQPQFDLRKIKTIQTVLDTKPVFTDEWLALMHFAATYYLYPIGQTIFNAITPALKTQLAVKYPEQAKVYQFNHLVSTVKPPHAKFQALNELWDTLKTSAITLEEAAFIHPNAKKYLQSYLQKGFLTEQLQNNHAQWEFCNKALNQEQQLASQAMIQDMTKFKVFLLYGVTGSGKTEVYFEAMNTVIQQKKQVLLLLPMINLTPQFFARVKKAFPQANIALLHSKIAKQQRLNHYLNASLGEAQIVIGTRLAVFTPLKNLGLVVVDEEHDDSFKQENNLRYQARDLAIWRAKYHQCPIILGSATPSIESWHYAQIQKYTLLTLKQRAIKAAQLPAIQLISLKNKVLQSGLASESIDAIRENLFQQRLTLVYLNRRGYAPTIICMDCGQSIHCPFCSAKMVLHKKSQRLKCHHCGHEQGIPTSCSSCGNQDLSAIGMGTEQLEQVLSSNFPSARVARVDSDTISNKDAWNNIYEKIQNNELDILVGTQILANGHDFNALSLVIVVNPDGSLFSADYRAQEKLFSELMQVSGRAGRSTTKGQVLIQSHFPEHPLYQQIQQGNYSEFAQQQLNDRISLGFPPKVHRIALKAEHLHYQQAESFLQEAVSFYTSNSAISIVGPLPMTMMKLANQERAIVFFESKQRNELHHFVKKNIAKILTLQSKYRNLKWCFDVDPDET